MCVRRTQAAGRGCVNSPASPTLPPALEAKAPGGAAGGGEREVSHPRLRREARPRVPGSWLGRPPGASPASGRGWGVASPSYSAMNRFRFFHLVITGSSRRFKVGASEPGAGSLGAWAFPGVGLMDVPGGQGEEAGPESLGSSGEFWGAENTEGGLGGGKRGRGAERGGSAPRFPRPRRAAAVGPPFALGKAAGRAALPGRDPTGPAPSVPSPAARAGPRLRGRGAKAGRCARLAAPRRRSRRPGPASARHPRRRPQNPPESARGLGPGL